MEYLQNQTNFSNSQLIDYFNRYTNFYSFDKISTQVKMISLSVSGSIGLIANILMFATLRKMAINNCTLIYHKAMTLIEILHMLFMLNFGILVYLDLSYPQNWWWVFFTEQTVYGWTVGDGLKLAISTLTAFLTFERFAAVCFPALYTKIKNKRVAYGAVVISLLTGCVHLCAIFQNKVVYNDQLGIYSLEKTKYYDILDYANDMIFALRIGLCIPIFIFCSATAICLKLELDKAMKMCTQAKADWIAKRRICALSLITGVCILIDHVSWVAHFSAKNQACPQDVGRDAVIKFTYDEAIHKLRERWWIAITGIIQTYTAQVIHCWRFFMYLCLNKVMRDALKVLMGFKVTNRVGPPVNQPNIVRYPM